MFITAHAQHAAWRAKQASSMNCALRLVAWRPAARLVKARMRGRSAWAETDDGRRNVMQTHATSLAGVFWLCARAAAGAWWILAFKRARCVASQHCKTRGDARFARGARTLFAFAARRLLKHNHNILPETLLFSNFRDSITYSHSTFALYLDELLPHSYRVGI